VPRRSHAVAARRRRYAIAALAVLVVVAAAFTLPVPGIYVTLPGPVRDVERLVSVRDARAYSSEGTLFLTTVNVDVSATAAEIVVALFHPHREVVPERQVTGGLTLEQVERAQRAQMILAQRCAREVAFAALALGEPGSDGAVVEPEVEADFSTGKIAGPSAGLVLSLALYDRLTPDDLTAGRRIAGTGTIGCSGRVSPVGGVEQKVAAAAGVGADVFLVPARNAAEARAAAGDIEILPVRSFADALGLLEDRAG
jgi:PDZ domain-containing secreted protein